MKEDERRYIMEHLMLPGFITCAKQEMVLEELNESGRSILHVQLLSDHNLCIANVDNKSTIFHFFRADDQLCMKKRVDHMIFEHLEDHFWKLHLIEMKSSVGEGKWTAIKGKFRASYLLGKAIAGMLELDIAKTVMYTTYEKVRFSLPDTMPSARRSRSGCVMVRMEEEWNGKKLGLNFGEQVSFAHKPIQMQRNAEGILVGDLVEADDDR